VHAHGSTDKLPYVTMGSGSLAAMAVFESAFKQNMKVSGSFRLVPMRVQATMLAVGAGEAHEF
jgi:20S proteasome subunit beta 2